MKRHFSVMLIMFFFFAGINASYGSTDTIEGDAKRGEILFNSPLLLGTLPISCASCHQDGQGLEKTYGKKEFAVLGSKVTRLESVNNFWIVNVLRGRGLKYESQEMKDLNEYIKSLYGKPARPLPRAIPLERLDVPEFYP